MRTCFLVAVGLFAASIDAGAQGGTVRGQVRGPSGDPIYAATVLVVGARVGAITDSAGRYVLAGIAAGHVTVRARLIGYTDSDRSVDLADGEVATIDFTLTPAAATLGAIRSEARPVDREVFESSPAVGVTIISGKVLSGVPRLGEADVLRAAQLLPGVEARNDFTAGLNVRGGEADQNLIQLDGYPIFNPFHLGGLFGTFIDGSVGDLELRTGGFPAPYGGRLSSVLDVRSADETRSGVHGTSTLSMLATSVAVGSAIDSGRGSWGVALRRTYADQVLEAIGLDALPYYFRDAQAHGTYRLGDRTRISLTAYDGRDDLTGDLAAASDAADGGGFSFWWGNRVVGTTLTHTRRDSVQLTQSASYTLFHTALDLGGGALQLDDQVREVSLAGSAARTRGRHATTIGYRLTSDHMSYVVGSSSASVELARELQDPLSLAAYIDDTWRPTPRTMVEGGLRYEQLQHASWHTVSPRLSGKFFATPNFALTAAVGRYSQWLHSINREDIPIRLFDFWTASDTLTPVATATHFVVGTESWFGSSRFVRLEGFVKDYDRLVEPNTADDPSVHGDEYLSTTGKSYGADLLVRQLERGRWGGWLAYTWTYNTRTNAGATYYPGQDRRNDLNVVVSWHPSDRYTLATRFGFASGTPYTDIVGQLVQRSFDISTGRWDTDRRATNVQAIGGPRNALRYPATQRLDLTLTRSSAGKVSVSPFVSLINAYDASNVFTYVFDYGVSPPTRTAYSQLPLLPTFGVTVAW